MAVIIDGSNGLSLPVPLSRPNGGTGSAASPVPAFSANASGTTTVPNNTITKIAYATKEFDTTGAFDNITNYRFQPQVAGYYLISAVFSWNAVSANATTVSRVYLYKNGASVRNIDILSSVNIIVMPTISEIIYLNGSTDYVEAMAYQNSGATQTVGATTLNRFQGLLIQQA